MALAAEKAHFFTPISNLILYDIFFLTVSTRSHRLLSKTNLLCGCQRHLAANSNTDPPSPPSSKDDKTASKQVIDSRKTIVKGNKPMILV